MFMVSAKTPSIDLAGLLIRLSWETSIQYSYSRRASSLHRASRLVVSEVVFWCIGGFVLRSFIHSTGRSSGHNPVPVAVVPPHRTHGGSHMQVANSQGLFRATPHIEGCPVNQVNQTKMAQSRVMSPTDYPASILKQSSV